MHTLAGLKVIAKMEVVAGGKASPMEKQPKRSGCCHGIGGRGSLSAGWPCTPQQLAVRFPTRGAAGEGVRKQGCRLGWKVETFLSLIK